MPIWEFDAVYFMYILMFFVFIHMMRNDYFKGILRGLINEIIKQKKVLL